MKTRNGFVSNSSSSSFVISYNKNEKIDTTCSTCNRGWKTDNMEQYFHMMFEDVHDNDYNFCTMDEKDISEGYYDDIEKEKY